MTKTLLAVDDSATMRKVLEITFAGEDFRVLTADGAQKALAQMREEPLAVVIDTSLGSEDAYELAREVRSRDARTAIVLMASRYNPYDVARGRSSGADDFIDKPFDTQALIDKVKKAILGHEVGAVASAAPPPVAASHPAPAAAPAHPAAPPAAAAAPSASAAPMPATRPMTTPFGAVPPPNPVITTPARVPFTAQRSRTLSFEGGMPAAPPPSPAPSPAAPAVAPAPMAAATRTVPSAMPAAAPAPQAPAPAPRAAAAAPAHVEAPVAAAINGHLAGQLGALGLSAEQASAVLALSREVVERVVWEVVPQLAETMIKEELARLTREG